MIKGAEIKGLGILVAMKAPTAACATESMVRLVYNS